MTQSDRSNLRWLDRAKALVDYHFEAIGFMARASEYFPVTPEDAEAICLLWVDADSLDEKLYGSLEAINEKLLESAGEIDVTRGADVVEGISGDETLVYQCTWSLDWQSKQRLAIVISIEPRSQSLTAMVQSSGCEPDHLSIPIQTDALQQALSVAYYRAVTASTLTP
jgi:hypothetical protein